MYVQRKYMVHIYYNSEKKMKCYFVTFTFRTIFVIFVFPKVLYWSYFVLFFAL